MSDLLDGHERREESDSGVDPWERTDGDAESIEQPCAAPSAHGRELPTGNERRRNVTSSTQPRFCGRGQHPRSRAAFAYFGAS